MFGVVLPRQLVPLPGLGIFPNSFGGFPDTFMLVEMFKFLVLRLFVGLFGSFAIEPALRGN
jgi:hypothetical protein